MTCNSCTQDQIRSKSAAPASIGGGGSWAASDESCSGHPVRLERVRGSAWKRNSTGSAPTPRLFTIAVVVFALTFIVAGRLQDKFGPFWISLTGAILVSLGFFLCAYTSSLN